MTSIYKELSGDTENDNLLPFPDDVLQSLDVDFNYQSPKPLQRRVLPSILATPHCSMIVQVSNKAYMNLCQWCALSLYWHSFDLLFAG